MTSRSRRQRLLIAQRPGPRLGSPPSWLNADEVRAWHDIAAACPDVVRAPDEVWLAITARVLAGWRVCPDTAVVRLLYRLLGDGFVRMCERRRLIFPDRVP